MDLEFDHIDPATKATKVVWVLSASFAVFFAEVNKCQLMCNAHHWDKTRLQRYGIEPPKELPEETYDAVEMWVAEKQDVEGVPF